MRLLYPESESNLLELKEKIPQNDQVIKTVIGFCNQKGGKLVIGVANDQVVTGVSENEVHGVLEWLDKSIYEACYPPIIPTISTQRFGDKSVIVITVAPGMNKPYFRKSEGIEKGTYIRVGRSTVRATKAMLQELKWSAARIDFEKLPIYQAKVDDIDTKLVQEFLNKRKNGAKAIDSSQVMQSYSLIAQEHNTCFPTNTGILLFGKNPQQYFSEAVILCTHFQGTKGREAIASIDSEGTLLNQFYQALNFITSRLAHSFSIKKIEREEKLEVPEIAIREALLNMLIHRNYHIPAPSKIAIYDDRIEFYSPGDFYGPIKESDYLKGITYLRNPAICKVFRELGLVEKMGTGFLHIFSSYLEQNLPSPQIIEGENFVKIILPRSAKIATWPGTDDSLLALFNIQEEVSLSDVIQKLSISRATAQRRLQALIDKNVIERVGKTRSVRYRRL